jgi:hypothetical protein
LSNAGRELRWYVKETKSAGNETDIPAASISDSSTYNRLTRLPIPNPKRRTRKNGQPTEPSHVTSAAVVDKRCEKWPRRKPETPSRSSAAVQPHVQHAAGPNPVAQPAAAVHPGPVLGVPQATWSDVPPELRLQVYDLVGNTFVLKPIPGSKLPGNIVPAFFQALLSDSGLERVNSTLLLELQAQLLTKRLFALRWP